jgi:putative N6-adenine-specific DNA methylase
VKKSDIYITCHPHIGPFLAQEVKSMGFEVLEEGTKGIMTSGSYSDTIKLNLHLRTANRVLFMITDFQAKDVIELYKGTNTIEWETLIPSDGYFSVDSNINHPGINDSRFPNLKLKDAIVDRIRQKTNRRPNSGPFRDRTVIFLHWHSNRARIYIDTSGETLSKHNYRMNPWKAPMIESLAAAAIVASKWEASAPFINPMCGSGTLAIEAALKSLNKPPALLRSNFGFKHTKLFDEKKWRLLRDEAVSDSREQTASRIIATDINPRAIKAAKENASNAKVEKYIDFQVCDFRETEIPEGDGTVFLNPEYGERIGEVETLRETYRDIGDFFKKQCAGKMGFVFTGNLDLAKGIGLKTSKRTIFYNAKIECRLLKFELYSGSKRNDPA